MDLGHIITQGQMLMPPAPASAAAKLNLMFIAFAFAAAPVAFGSAAVCALAGHRLIYRASGITIVSCVILAALSNLLPASVNAHWPLLFIFEAVAVFSFGFSWFVKGRTMEEIRTRVPWIGVP
jgi:hypothetical protein